MPEPAPGRAEQGEGQGGASGGAERGPKSAERARLGRRREGRSAAPGVAAPGAVRVHRFSALIFGANKKRGEPAELPPASVIGKAYHADALPLKRRERSGRTPALPYPLRGAKADFITRLRPVPLK